MSVNKIGKGSPVSRFGRLREYYIENSLLPLLRFRRLLLFLRLLLLLWLARSLRGSSGGLRADSLGLGAGSRSLRAGNRGLRAGSGSLGVGKISKSAHVRLARRSLGTGRGAGGGGLARGFSPGCTARRSASGKSA